MVQVHRSTPSCHDSQDDNNLLFFDGASQSAASADCLLESTGCQPVDTSDGAVHRHHHTKENSTAVNQSMDDLLECPVCLLDKLKEDFPEVQTCHHRSCSTCLKQYFRIEIMESRVGITCPECSELFHPNDIKAIVEDDVLTQKYEVFMLRRVLAVDPDTRWCPAPDCGYAVIASGCASCPRLKCERQGCNTNFCYHCKQYWHPNQTCDAARAERSPNIRSVSVSYSQESAGQNEIKSCPRCSAFIIKMDDESCNHMTCAVCEAHFCWLCLKEVSDLHYLSPSGCTFWGRKQWSRKKKILWQLGILVGAPVGITLVAGLAVPAMIIGIPVWVGKKIHYRYEHASKRKRNLAITGSVTASIFAAPVIATVAVGIGVPILLTYIYGVVPISLCRSGGCGVTTTNSGGVRFEFDEDEANTRGVYSYAGDNHSMETGPHVANPSIAPSIGDASLGMTNSLSASGSHMDRVGVLRDDSDRDSSSHRAMAGTSINGSLCSATYSTQLHKLEVQADISEHGGLCERTSMGGESYSMSLNDDASTRALAGSIISPKDKDGVSVCSRLFDGNGNVTSAPLVYPEEVEEKEDSVKAAGGANKALCAVSGSSSYPQQQRQTSSSCPTSPTLRKASSPTPNDDGKSTRGKKCTRFMDQVPEMEDMKGTSGSVGSITSTGSALGYSDEQMADPPITTSGTPTYSTMSLTSAPVSSLTPVQHSCHSLASEDGGSDVLQQTAAPHRMGKKAESTSVLMDSAESRRFEMSGSRLTREEGCPSGKHGGRRSEKDRGSQPINLSDISKVSQGVHHTTGCHDLLSVVDTSGSDRMLSDRATRYKLSSHFQSVSSSSSSSMDDPADLVVPSSRRFSYKHNLLTSSLEGVEEDSAIQTAEQEQEHGSLDELTDSDVFQKTPETTDGQQSPSRPSMMTNGVGNLTETSGVSLYLKEHSPHVNVDRKDPFSTSHTTLGGDFSLQETRYLPEVEITTPSGKFLSLSSNQQSGDALGSVEKSTTDNSHFLSSSLEAKNDSSKQIDLKSSQVNQKSPKRHACQGQNSDSDSSNDNKGLLSSSSAYSQRTRESVSDDERTGLMGNAVLPLEKCGSDQVLSSSANVKGHNSISTNAIRRKDEKLCSETDSQCNSHL